MEGQSNRLEGKDCATFKCKVTQMPSKQIKYHTANPQRNKPPKTYPQQSNIARKSGWWNSPSLPLLLAAASCRTVCRPCSNFLNQTSAGLLGGLATRGETQNMGFESGKMGFFKVLTGHWFKIQPHIPIKPSAIFLPQRDAHPSARRCAASGSPPCFIKLKS